METPAAFLRRSLLRTYGRIVPARVAMRRQHPDVPVPEWMTLKIETVAGREYFHHWTGTRPPPWAIEGGALRVLESDEVPYAILLPAAGAIGDEYFVQRFPEHIPLCNIALPTRLPRARALKRSR